MPRDPGRYAPDAAYYVQCSNVLDEGGVPTDWPGWRRVAGIEDACCILDSPTNLGGSIPQLTWHECASATGVHRRRVRRMRRSRRIRRTDAAPVLFDLEVSLDSGGRPELILLGRAIDEPNSGDAEYEVYDFGSGRPLAAWRNKIAPKYFIVHRSDDVANSIETIARAYTGPVMCSMRPGRQPHSSAPRSFLRLRGVPWQLAVQKHGTSSTTFAFDLAPAGIVDRVRIGASLLRYTSTP